MKASAAFSETLRAVDARADGAVRDISFGREKIIIRRRLGGVDMKVDVPTNAYRGVVLSLVETTVGRTYYRISLAHRDPELAVVLEEAQDDRDIVAEWKAWANLLCLPKLIEREAGVLVSEELRLGVVALGRGWKLRRRGASLSKRRPRQPLRRKVGQNKSVRKSVSTL